MAESDELLFSSKPRSFKMDRRSRAACRLKAAVLQKLVEFLDDYTDDDLAEYIVVLVCNGKQQNQARDDLDAFLGDSSGKFVSWLWNHLSKEICIPESLALAQPLVNKDDSAACHISNDVHETKGATETERNVESRLPIINSNTKPPVAITVLEASQCSYSGKSDPFIYVNCKESQQQTSQILSSVAVIDELRKTTKIYNSSTKSFSEISCNSDKAGLNSEDRCQKIGESKTSAAPQFSLMEDFSSENERSITRANPQGPSSAISVGRPSTQAMDSQNARRRVSVWDRLGKPSRMDDDANTNIHTFTTASTGRKRVRHAENWPGEHRPKIEEDGIKEIGRDAVGMTGFDEHPAKITLLSLTHEPHDSVQAADSMKRIRQFKVKGVDDSVSLSSSQATASQVQETCKNIHQLVPISSYASPGSLELPISRNARCSGKCSKTLSNPRGKPEASTASPNTQPSQSRLLIDKFTHSSSVVMNSNHLPAKNDNSDFDSPLLKVKRTMHGLHTKQVEISKDAKAVSLGPSTQCHGVQHQHAEDAEGRTLFVTNVHFAAPKKALLLHFSKFGPIVNVTLLMDSLTGMSKGCAYIVFRFKDSAEKALSLNGTSFFSRTLKVMWKADMPEDNLGPRQWGSTSLNYSWSQGIGSPHFHKQYYAPHLKWKRELQGNEEISGRSEASSKQG